MSNIIQFEAFKNAKQWDDEYPQFLGAVEKCFGAKTDPDSFMKRLYYAMRYLDGITNTMDICRILGIEDNIMTPENEKGRKLMASWLRQILEKIEG